MPEMIAQVPLAWQHYQGHYTRLNGLHSGLSGGGFRLAALAQQSLSLACLTNKPTAFAKQLLERRGLDTTSPMFSVMPSKEKARSLALDSHLRGAWACPRRHGHDRGLQQ